MVNFQSNVDYFHGNFDIGVCLHACGVATDLVLQRCLDNQANFVICPCCYGGIQVTHTMNYPRSEAFRKADVSYKVRYLHSLEKLPEHNYYLKAKEFFSALTITIVRSMKSNISRK